MLPPPPTAAGTACHREDFFLGGMEASSSTPGWVVGPAAAAVAPSITGACVRAEGAGGDVRQARPAVTPRGPGRMRPRGAGAPTGAVAGAEPPHPPSDTITPRRGRRQRAGVGRWCLGVPAAHVLPARCRGTGTSRHVCAVAPAPPCHVMSLSRPDMCVRWHRHRRLMSCHHCHVPTRVCSGTGTAVPPALPCPAVGLRSGTVTAMSLSCHRHVLTCVCGGTGTAVAP